MGVSLVMFTQRGERREFAVEGESAVIGRTRQADIQVPLPEISRRHCEIYFEDDKPRVKDLGSSNGTYVNNRRIQEVELAAGHTLTVGPVIFTVVIDGEPATIKPIKTMVEQKNGHAGKAEKPAKNGHHKKSFVAPDDSAIDFGTQGGDLMSLDEEDDNPLAELEAISKQKVKRRR